MTKKRSFWVLFAVMVLVGAFLMVFLGSQNQLPVVPDVNAQGMVNLPYNPASGYISPGDIMFPGGMVFPGAISPGDIMFPGDIIFNLTSPSGDNRSGSSSLTTLMTCYGCGHTMSTCNWNCGPTFSNCGGPVLGGSSGNTILFCPTSMNCPGVYTYAHVSIKGVYDSAGVPGGIFSPVFSSSKIYEIPSTLIACPLRQDVPPHPIELPDWMRHCSITYVPGSGPPLSSQYIASDQHMWFGQALSVPFVTDAQAPPAY